MNRCPSCQTDLTDDQTQSGTCPACSHSIVPGSGQDDPTSPTIQWDESVQPSAAGETVPSIVETFESAIPASDSADMIDSADLATIEGLDPKGVDETFMPPAVSTDATGATDGQFTGPDETIVADSLPLAGPGETIVTDGLPAGPDETILADSLPLSGPDETIVTDGLPVGPGETIVADSLPSGEVGDETELASEDALRPDQTLVASAFREALAGQTIDAMWSDVVDQPGVNNTTSIKLGTTPQSQTIGESHLVVQQRSVGDPDVPAVKPSDYDLVELLGQGGMGMVYAARQASIDRTVALKMIKPDFSSDEVARNKFLSEACVTGDLEHPNIVPIYDLGRNDDGAFFYAMKRVQGTPWDDVIAEKSQPENVDILMRVSDAIAFAHDRGIVHRDLKPENIMLGGFGEVLVMDWGLAIPTDRDRRFGGLEQVPSLGGTPAYMAPEMIVGPFDKIGPASDIYLLGAILYEITTGVRAHTGKDARDCLQSAAKNKIQPTDKSGELIDIALRAMETEPADRYANVTDFQQAIRDYQSHSESIAVATLAAEHLEAAGQSNDYEDFSQAVFGFQQALELWSGNETAKSGLVDAKYAYADNARAKGDLDLAAGLLDVSVPRHAELHEQIVEAQHERDARQQRLRTYKRVGIAMVALFTVSMTCASVVIYRAKEEADRQRVYAEREHDEAVSQRKRAEENEEEAKANALAAAKNAEEARKAERAANKAREREAYQAYVARIAAVQAKIDENAFDVARDLLQQCIPDPTDETAKDYRGWEWGHLMHLCSRSKEFNAGMQMKCIAAVPTLARFAVGGASGTVLLWDSNGQATPIETGNTVVNAVSFSPDQKQLAVAGASDSGAALQIYSVATQELVVDLSPVEGGHDSAINSVQYSADGARLLTASDDHTARVWDLQSRQVLGGPLHGHGRRVWQARFLPPNEAATETRLVTVSDDGTAIVWTDPDGDWSAAQESPPFTEHKGGIYAVDVAPDGVTIATAGHDQRVLVWNADEIVKFDLAAASRNEPVTSHTEYRELAGHTKPVRSLSFSTDGKQLVTSGDDHTVKLWNVDSGEAAKTFEGHGKVVPACVLSYDQQSILSAGYDEVVRHWDVGTYQDSQVLRGQLLSGHYDAVLSARFAPDSQSVVTASRDRRIKTWSVETGEQTPANFARGHTFLATNAVFFTDGDQDRLATAAVDNTARIWDADSGRQLHVLNQTGRSAVVVASPDGSLLLTGGPTVEAQTPQQRRRAFARLWNARTGELVEELAGHSGSVSAAAFSADGSHFFTADATGLGLLWVTETLTSQPIRWHRAKISNARFLADNRTLITSTDEPGIAVWSYEKGQVVEDPSQRAILVHPQRTRVLSMDASPDGRYVLTAGDDRQLRLWDLESASQVRQHEVQHDGEPIELSHVAMSTDGETYLAIGGEGRVVAVYETASGNPVEFRQTGGRAGHLLELPASQQVVSAAFSPDGSQIISAGGDLVRLWELNVRQLQYRRLRRSFSPYGVVASACFSTDGKWVASASWDKTATIADSLTGETLVQITGTQAGHVNSVAFSPDDASRYLLTGSDDATAVLCDSETGDVIRRFGGPGKEGHTQAILSVGFSPDGRRIITASADGHAMIWDVNDSSKPILTLNNAHPGGVNQAVYSHDGKVIATAGADDVARIWNAIDGTLLGALLSHTDAVTSVAFSPNGQQSPATLRLLTGSRDGTAKVWDATEFNSTQNDGAADEGNVPQGVELLTLGGRNQPIMSVEFSANGAFVVTASEDGTAMIWEAETSHPQRTE